MIDNILRDIQKRLNKIEIDISKLKVKLYNINNNKCPEEDHAVSKERQLN